MCFLMAGCADRSPGLRTYRRARGFIYIVPGDAARIARNRSTGRSGDWHNANGRTSSRIARNPADPDFTICP
jgi:hypothetical protein